MPSRFVRPALLACAALLAAPAAWANCNYPRAPASMPNGAKATQDEMVAAQQAVRQYVTEMETYLKCLETEHAPVADPAALSDEERKLHETRERMRVQKHNAAVGEMESVAERFNVQLKAFRAQQGKKR